MNDERTGRSDRNFEEFFDELMQFVRERGWKQFHTPRSLAVSISVETGELLEHVQWRGDAELDEYLADPRNRKRWPRKLQT